MSGTLYRLATFHRYFAFDLPRATTAAGVTALAGVVAIHLFLVVDGFGTLPGYLAAYFALIAAVCLAATTAMLVGWRPGLTRIGWALGSTASLASIAMYLASRTAGLPDLGAAVGRWDTPLGTFAMVLAATFLATHASVVAGVNVAHPDRRHWSD